MRTSTSVNARLWSSIGLSVLGHALLACWLAIPHPRTELRRPWIEVQLFSAGEVCGTGDQKPGGDLAGGHETGEALVERGTEAFVPAGEPAKDGGKESAAREEVRQSRKVEESPPAVRAPAKRKSAPEKPRRMRTASAKPPEAVQREEQKDRSAVNSSCPGAGNGEDSGSPERGASGGAQGRSEGEGPGKDGADGRTQGRHPAEVRFGSADGPDFLKKTLPKYPRVARRMGKEGTVLLRVTIDERGLPVEVEILNRAGSGFDEEAVQAVRNSVFTPARKDGRPVACRALLPVRFTLANAA
ncbi:MAG: TonB family protein [Syntrophobacteraceae bacterium]|nr:TonB family protein [Desulfobacteraceae bacterium]